MNYYLTLKDHVKNFTYCQGHEQIGKERDTLLITVDLYCRPEQS